jgi:hypothetical protein
MADQRGFFDLGERYAALSAAGIRWSGWRRWWTSRCSGLIWMRRWRARTGRRAVGRPMTRS